MRIGHGQSFGVLGPFFHGAPLIFLINFFTFLVNFGRIWDRNTYIVNYDEDRSWPKFWSHRIIFSWGPTQFS